MEMRSFTDQLLCADKKRCQCLRRIALRRRGLGRILRIRN